MKKGQSPVEGVGTWAVIQVNAFGRMTWVEGLVREEDARRLCEQANQATEQQGKAARYVVEEIKAPRQAAS